MYITQQYQADNILNCKLSFSTKIRRRKNINCLIQNKIILNVLFAMGKQSLLDIILIDTE